MRILTLTILILFTFTSIVIAENEIVKNEQNYYSAAVTYFQTSPDSLKVLLKHGVKGEDIPVAMFIATNAKMSFDQLGKLKGRGDSWQSITKNRNFLHKNFYFMTSGKFDSKTYSPIFAKFQGDDVKNIDQVVLDDKEIVELVNLRFIYSHYDHSVFDVMSMRDYGKDFMKINRDVAKIKEDMNKKALEEEKKAAKAEKAKEGSGE